MDSREYVFLFPVNTPADIPADFRPSVQQRSFQAGMFLPQDGTNWFTRTAAYPARLLLLNERCLSITAHPTAQEPSIELILDDLIQIETGNHLLHGWIRFKTRLANHHLIYNTKASRSLDRFMTVLRRHWLGDPSPQSGSHPKAFGDEPDIKFKNMLEDTLDPNETVLSQYFAAPLENRHRFGLFRRVAYEPGHLIALTSGHRLLWLHDEYRGHWARYAGICVSVPMPLLKSADLQRSPDGDDLLVKFAGNFSWRIALHRSDPTCEVFMQTLRDYTASQLQKGQKVTTVQ